MITHSQGRRNMAKPDIDFSRLLKHNKIALMFSGGKDSLALLHLFGDFLDCLTVYHCDAGDLLPEIRERVAAIAKTLPRFVRIEANAPAWIAANATPSDLVPARCMPPGLTLQRGGGRRICTIYECCAANRWQPMTSRLKADGITLMIQGQRRADVRQLPNPDGHRVSGGMETWLPIQDWSDAEVFAYLKAVGVQLGPFYANNSQGPECATCSAGWSEGRGAYLRKHHPELAARYGRHLAALVKEISPVAGALMSEMKHLGRSS